MYKIMLLVVEENLRGYVGKVNPDGSWLEMTDIIEMEGVGAPQLSSLRRHLTKRNSQDVGGMAEFNRLWRKAKDEFNVKLS